MYINPLFAERMMNDIINRTDTCHLCSSDPADANAISAASLGSNKTYYGPSDPRNLDVSINLYTAAYSAGQFLASYGFQVRIKTAGTANLAVFTGQDGISAKVYIEPMPVQSDELVTINQFKIWSVEQPSF